MIVKSLIFINKALISNLVKIEYDVVEYKNKKYLVCKTRTRNKLFIVDYIFINTIPYINWYYHNEHNEGYIYTQYKSKLYNNQISLLLHNYVMNKLTFNGRSQLQTIDHINRIKTDNRLENQRFASPTEQNINQTKRQKRKIKLPKNCNIKLEDIPKCVIYKKTKNEEFFYIKIRKFPNIGFFRKDSSKSSKLSLKYKFEEIKKFLRQLKKKYPDDFKKLNIEQTSEITKIIKSYNEIVKLSKFINNTLVKINKKNYLKENLFGLTIIEKLKELNDLFI